jgi:hypothetical protein
METGTKQVWVRGNNELPSAPSTRKFRPRNHLIPSTIPVNHTKSHLKNKNAFIRPLFPPFAPVKFFPIHVHLCSSVVKAPVPGWISTRFSATISRMFRHLSSLALLLPATLFLGCRTLAPSAKTGFSHFVGFDNFSTFTLSQNERGETILLSPEIKAAIPWNELIVSWNADAPSGTFLKVEASAHFADHTTKFYTLGDWSPDNKAFPRSSVRNQKDADGSVHTDTLALTQLADAVQIRVILGGVGSAQPTLKFLGASFSNTKVPTAAIAPNRAAWGKIVATPERSQHGYPDASGWCSPASLSMTLARWAEILNRPEMNLTVPQVAGAVYDASYGGTGNWPFNTAFAGSFKGMRSYVTRFDDLSEVEDWIAAGIPVILSARWDWLKPGRLPDAVGHLIVCTGFTENGDVIINDPSAHLDRGQTVRQIYKREDVLHAWSSSHHTVYLVYPITAALPENRYGHWRDNPEFNPIANGLRTD